MSSHQHNDIFRRFNETIYAPGMDVVAGSLYDSMVIRAGAPMFTVTELFTYPESAAKTLIDTNLTQARRLDAPESFSVESVVFSIPQRCNPVDVARFCEEAIWEFWLGRKCYGRTSLIMLPTMHQPIAPIRTCTFCQAVYCNQDRCPGCGAQDFTLGMGEELNNSRRFVWDLGENRLIIHNQMSFYAVFKRGFNQFVPKQDFKLWCHLVGLHARGVQ